MIPLLQAITTKLLEVHPRVYLEQAPSNTVFPYIVYHPDTSNMDEIREDFIVTVDVWFSGTNTLSLETLTHEITKALDRFHIYNDNIQISFYLISRMMIPDPDTTIRRRQIRFQAKTYFLEG